MPGSGIFSTCGYSAEETWGTFVAPDHFLTMLKEDGEYKKTPIQADTLDGQLYLLSDRRSIGKVGASQTLDLNLYDRGLGLLFNNAFGANTVTSGTSSTYTQVFTAADTTGNSLSIQVGRPMTNNTTIQAISYAGCKITELNIGVKAAELATFTATFDAMEEDSTQSYTAPSYTTNNILTGVQAQLLIGGTPSTSDGVTSVSGGTAVPLTKDVSIKFANGQNTERYYLGSVYKLEQIINKKRLVTGSLTLDFNDLATVYTAFKADTPTALQLNITGPIIGGAIHSAIKILLPIVYWDTDKFPAASMDLIEQSVTFSALYDGTNNAAQVTLVTLDSTI